MKLFATRVWGFDPATWPLVTFGLDGNRDNLLKNSAVGDYVVFVGTQSEPTQEHERGRLLGIAQFGRLPVETLDVLDKADIDPNNYNERGDFRWPKALLMTQAWSFSDQPRPLLLDVLEKQLPFNATAQAVELNETDTTAIMALPTKAIELPDTPVLRRLRQLDVALRRGVPTIGVVPTAWQSKQQRILGDASVTYALQFSKFDCWKIGWTTDLRKRLSEINRHIPVEVLKHEWKPVLQQKWPDENLAFEMEQRVLNALEKHRTIGERLHCRKQELESAWVKAIVQPVKRSQGE